jgi:hypothetical protein
MNVQDPDGGSNLHCVHVFESAELPATQIANFLFQGLRQGEGAVLITSREHASHIESKVEEHGLNVRKLTEAGLWVVTEVADLVWALESGMSASEVVESFIELVVRPAQEISDTGCVRIYGELVDAILTRLGDSEAAMEVERYGNRLAAEGAAKVYCGYSTNAFPDAGFAKPFIKLCQLHDQVHNSLKDREDWRFQMAEKMASL